MLQGQVKSVIVEPNANTTLTNTPSTQNEAQASSGQLLVIEAVFGPCLGGPACMG